MHGATSNDSDELFYNSDTCTYEMRPIANAAQRSMFDDDMDSAPIEQEEDDYSYENTQ